MVSNDHHVMSVIEMKEGFPPQPAPISGEHNLQELLHIIKYLSMVCSQIHDSPIANVNLLFVTLSPELYTICTNEDYTDRTEDPGPLPDYEVAIDGNDCTLIKGQRTSMPQFSAKMWYAT